MNYKIVHVKMTPQVHKELKLRAFETGKTINQLAVELFTRGLNEVVADDKATPKEQIKAASARIDKAIKKMETTLINPKPPITKTPSMSDPVTIDPVKVDATAGSEVVIQDEPEIEELQYGGEPKGLTKILEDGTEFDMTQLEMACCKKAKPCQHWVSSEDGYENTLSGVFKPFELS